MNLARRQRERKEYCTICKAIKTEREFWFAVAVLSWE
jgi:hypothetical protein